MTTFLVIFKQNIQKECDGIPELLDFASEQRAAPPNYPALGSVILEVRVV